MTSDLHKSHLTHEERDELMGEIIAGLELLRQQENLHIDDLLPTRREWQDWKPVETSDWPKGI